MKWTEQRLSSLSEKNGYRLRGEAMTTLSETPAIAAEVFEGAIRIYIF